MFTLLALAIFGRGIVAAPAHKVIGDPGADKTIFIWAFKWWPYALAHGHDPFDANVAWVPGGIDLSWVTGVPLLSYVLWPITSLAGPIAAYNVAVLFALAVSAWGAYLLARELGCKLAPSLVGGWLFGFSAFEIGHAVGHLNLLFVAFIPTAALLVVRRMDRRITDIRLAVLLGLVLAGEFLTSTELYLDLLLVGAVFWVCLYALVISRRVDLIALLRPVTGAFALSLLLVSPYIWHAFVVSGTANAPERSPYSEAADLANFLVPTRLIWLQLPRSANIASHFTATGSERGAYLGIPLVALVITFFWAARRSRVVVASSVALVALVIAAAGSSIRVAGHGLVPGPWKILAVLPVTKSLLPIRLTVFITLIASMAVAMFLSNQHRPRWRLVIWLVAIIGVLFVLPNPSSQRWTSDVPNPRFFANRGFSQSIPLHSTVLVLPYGGGGWSLYWQAEQNFRFKLVGGHFGRVATPGERAWKDVYQSLGYGPAPSATRFRRFLKLHDVSYVVVAQGTKLHARRIVASLGSPTHQSDVLVYRVP
jgi:hypothetical protein